MFPFLISGKDQSSLQPLCRRNPGLSGKYSVAGGSKYKNSLAYVKSMRTLTFKPEICLLRVALPSSSIITVVRESDKLKEKVNSGGVCLPPVDEYFTIQINASVSLQFKVNPLSQLLYIILFILGQSQLNSPLTQTTNYTLLQSSRRMLRNKKPSILCYFSFQISPEPI